MKLKQTRHEDLVKRIAEIRQDIELLEPFTMKWNEPISIKCKCGTQYKQRPDKIILNQKGCPICGNPSNYNQTTETFITKAQKVHGTFYDYSLVKYVKAKEKVTIICPIHGEFLQSPRDHATYKHGCPKCKPDKIKEVTGWTYTKWKESGEKSKQFDGFKLYRVRCYDPKTHEEFVKIGKTYVKLHLRLQGIPYEYEVLSIVEGSARFISELENTEHTKLKSNKYIPEKQFSGKTECFLFTSKEDFI